MKTHRTNRKGPHGKKMKHKSLKAQIRDIQRLLQRKKDMQPQVKQQFEEQIADLQAQIKTNEQKNRLTKLHRKYKGLKFIGVCFTRFFVLTFFLEKTKIQRRLNQLRTHHEYLLDPKHHKAQLIQSKYMPSTPMECFNQIKEYEDLLLYVEVCRTLHSLHLFAIF